MIAPDKASGPRQWHLLVVYPALFSISSSFAFYAKLFKIEPPEALTYFGLLTHRGNKSVLMEISHLEIFSTVD